MIGGGAARGGDLLLEPARAVVAARALPPARESVRIVPAHYGDEAGMIGAALMALEAAPMSGRLVVCPTPIGNLEDVTLRVLSALRDADVVACEDTRRTRVLLDRYGVEREARLLPRAQRAVARVASWSERMRDGRRGRARVGRRACRSCPTPATCWCAAASPPGCRWRCCRGRRRRSPRWWPRGCRPTEWHFQGFLPAEEGRAARGARAARRHARGVRVSAPAAGHARAAGRARPGARGGRLPRADEGLRGDRARQRRRAGRALRGQAAEGRDRAGGRRRPRSARPTRPTPRPSTPCASSWTRAHTHGRPPRWSPP